MEREQHWSPLAGDFEKRLYYVAGKENIQEMQRILGEQRLSGQILELGAGHGTYSSLLASGATKLYVTDFSEEMLEVCRKRMENLPGVDVEKQNCFSLTYAEDTFDGVVMINLLHVIGEPEKALSEAHRVLKKGAVLVIMSFTTEGMQWWPKLTLMCRYLRGFGKPPATSRKLTVQDTASMLESQGFDVEDARLVGITNKAIFARARKN